MAISRATERIPSHSPKRHKKHVSRLSCIIFLLGMIAIAPLCFMNLTLKNIITTENAHDNTLGQPWGMPKNYEVTSVDAAVIAMRADIERCPEFQCGWPGRKDCTNTIPSPLEYGKLLPQIKWSSVIKQKELECSRTKQGSWDFDGNDNMDFLIFYLFFFPELLKGGQTPWGRTGVVVEFGAQDGISASNSRFFDRLLGWETLLIEPTSCVDVLKRNRPQATIVKGAICRDRKQISLPGSATWCPKHDVDHKSLETVECYPLRDVFQDHKIDLIDFMSVDCEGLEMDALESIDFSAVKIRVMIVEWRKSDRDERRAYLAKYGYMSTFISEKDELFWRPDLFADGRGVFKCSVC